MDQVRVHVVAGSGGQGTARFGAVGGAGGDVIAIADANVRSLSHIGETKRYHAEAGEIGSKHSAERKGAGTVV